MDREQFDQIEANLGDDSPMVHKFLKVIYANGELHIEAIASKLGVDISEAERLLAITVREGLVE